MNLVVLLGYSGTMQTLALLLRCTWCYLIFLISYLLGKVYGWFVTREKFTVPCSLNKKKTNKQANNYLIGTIDWTKDLLIPRVKLILLGAGLACLFGGTVGHDKQTSQRTAFGQKAQAVCCVHAWFHPSQLLTMLLSTATQQATRRV